MQSQSCEFSYFLNCEKDLESLAEDHFSARPAEAEAEDDQLYAILAKGTKMSTAAIASVDVLLTGTLIHRLTKTSLFWKHWDGTISLSFNIKTLWVG